MENLEERLEQLRLEDIEFFAKKYAELFGKYFGITTPSQLLDFENEIKSILNKNVTKYVVDNSKLSHSAAGQSLPDKIILSDYNYEDRQVRIHELVHSFNQIDMRKHGLRDFDNDFVLKYIDEGSTEMIAQLMLGNTELKNTNYSSEVEITNFLTHLVGEKLMIQATRGNPQLLSQEVDRLLGTTDFLRKLEDISHEQDQLISQRFGKDYFWGTEIPEEIKIMSTLKLETCKTPLSILYEAVQKTNNPQLITQFNQTDNDYGYNFVFLQSIKPEIKVSPQEPTIASVQQQMILQELDRLTLSTKYEPKNILKKELLKFLYDKIDFQRYFVGKENYQYGEYQLSQEDINYCESFRSLYDGSEERLGGRLGLTGVGNKVNELDNVIFNINREYANKIWLDIEWDELLDKRLEIISEQLLIAQQIGILKEWKHYIKNSFLNEEFPDYDDDMLEEIFADLQSELEISQKQVIEKYRHPNIDEVRKTNIIENTQQQSQTHIQRPHIKSDVVKKVIEGDKMPLQRPYIKPEVVRTVTERDSNRLEEVPYSNKQKEDLIRQRQGLRRAQFQQRASQMGLHQQPTPTLNDLFQQQQIIQQREQELEEEMGHGMSM